VKLQEAVKKLPDSVSLERTLGDVAVVQGRFDDALVRYRAALAMDAKDVSSRFRLGQVLRKTNKLDEASTVFDDVYTADKNYPGLASNAASSSSNRGTWRRPSTSSSLRWRRRRTIPT